MKREPAGGVEVAVRRVRPGDEERIASLSGQLGYPSAPEEIRSRLERLTEQNALSRRPQTLTG